MTNSVATRMSAVEYRAFRARQRETKAGRIKGAVRTRVGDIWFASALEATRYLELLMLVKGGQITDLDCQVKIPLTGQDGPILTPTGRQMNYVADFTYREAGQLVIEDAKGHRTDTYRMKRAILKAMGIEVREVMRRPKRKRP